VGGLRTVNLNSLLLPRKPVGWVEILGLQSGEDVKLPAYTAGGDLR
jgi:hypothetical protein